MEDWAENIIWSDELIERLLRPGMRIAVVGLKQEGPSFDVASYLQRQGHRIIPVTPKLPEVLGERAYRSLLEIPGKIDIIDVFRASQRVMSHVEETLTLTEPPEIFWMQLGIRNDKAAERLARAGIKVIQDRCLKIVWGRLQRL